MRSERLDSAAADSRLVRGEAVGPLHGVPIAVKDLCWTTGIPTSAGTMIHRDFMLPPRRRRRHRDRVR